MVEGLRLLLAEVGMSGSNANSMEAGRSLSGIPEALREDRPREMLSVRRCRTFTWNVGRVRAQYLADWR